MSAMGVPSTSELINSDCRDVFFCPWQPWNFVFPSGTYERYRRLLCVRSFDPPSPRSYGHWFYFKGRCR